MSIIKVNENIEIHINFPEDMDIAELSALTQQTNKIIKAFETPTSGLVMKKATGKYGRRWTEKEIEFLKNNIKTKKISEIATLLGMTKSTVYNRIKYMGLKIGNGYNIKNKEETVTNYIVSPSKLKNKKGKPRGVDWTPEMVDYLKRNYDKIKRQELSEMISTASNQSVSSKAVSDKITYMKKRGEIQ